MSDEGLSMASGGGGGLVVFEVAGSQVAWDWIS